MPRKVLPKFGPVNERTFPAPRVGPGMLDLLEDFKGRGLISDYRHVDGLLTVWRPWVEGQTQDEVFRDLSMRERISNSRQLFRLVQSKLDELEQGHGALHPRNIILRREGGFALVDARFNRICMSSPASLRDDSWLWGPCVPEGWEMANWDLVSLLRTAALLAQDPSLWLKAQPDKRETADLCRGWAENLLASAPSSADFASRVYGAVDLLDEILRASFNPNTEALFRETTDTLGSEVPDGAPTAFLSGDLETPQTTSPLPKEEKEPAAGVSDEEDELQRRRIHSLLRYASRSIVRNRPDEALGYIEEIFN